MSSNKPIPVFGDASISASDYSDPKNWLSLPDATQATGEAEDGAGSASNLQAGGGAGGAVDVFFVYPTSWRARGGWPLSSIDNPEMRRWARYYLQTRASAFATVGRIYAPYYRQMDAEHLVALGVEQSMALEFGVPLSDVAAAFSYYLTRLNNGRPFLLAGHSQGSIVLLGLLMHYLDPSAAGTVAGGSAGGSTGGSAGGSGASASSADALSRMVAAYLPGSVITQELYAKMPHLSPATQADDTGVIISYNTEAPRVEGTNPFSSADAVTINPISWTREETLAPSSQSKGGILARSNGSFEVCPHLADARLDASRGTIICSTVDAEKFSSQGASRGYFPLGVLHENDIPLYYFDLRANAELRVQSFLAR
ncbi:MAG: DUF3089 domain-containing protein [Coriobacteriales bacterium]|nr:DUF3089 domain-containing protein [Coriobacteriales bacterium]